MRWTKSALALILTLLFVSQVAVMVAVAAEIQHPRLIVYGQVTKPVYVGRSIFEYKDDQGLSSFLPFNRTDENITINFEDILFTPNLHNTTITDVTVDNALTLTRDYLTVNDLSYIYMKITNSSALSASTVYRAYIKQVVDMPISNDNYMVFTGLLHKVAGDNLGPITVCAAFYCKDQGAIDRGLVFIINPGASSDSISSTSGTLYDTFPNSIDYVYYQISCNDNQWVTKQIKIEDMLEKAGVNWVLTKVTAIYYVIKFTTGSTLDASSSIEAKIRNFFLTTGKVYIDDPSYENGLVINGTSGQFTPSAGDTIQIYGANATKIVGVTIPWQVEVTPEIDADPDNLRMQYTWTFTMPKSPSEVGDTLTFSNTNMTLIGYKDGSAWDKLYLNGVDKLSSIASLKVDETLGYWKYALATSLTEGNMYQAIGRVEYTAEEYDSLTDVPLFWQNPVAWIMYKFWSLMIAIAAFFGLSTSWMIKQRRKAQIPRR